MTKRRWLGGLLLLASALFLWHTVRPRLRPLLPEPDKETLEQAARVAIDRDSFGVAHVFGKTDADAAFGLAYAHAEDDWPTIQGVLAASKGRLSLILLGEKALANDFYAGFIGVEDELDAHYNELDPHFAGVLEAYARGLNFYAVKHREEVDTRLLPFRGRDIAGGFAHKLPILIGVTEQLSLGERYAS